MVGGGRQFHEGVLEGYLLIPLLTQKSNLFFHNVWPVNVNVPEKLVCKFSSPPKNTLRLREKKLKFLNDSQEIKQKMEWTVPNRAQVNNYEDMGEFPGGAQGGGANSWGNWARS